MQRYGSTLNLDVHPHMLGLEGVYTQESGGPSRHRTGYTTLERRLSRLVHRIVRRLSRDGHLIEDTGASLWLNLRSTWTRQPGSTSTRVGIESAAPRRETQSDAAVAANSIARSGELPCSSPAIR